MQMEGCGRTGNQRDHATRRFVSGASNRNKDSDVTDAQQFASDNYAGICPEAWQAMDRANRGSASAYGDDDWTQRASDAFRDLFEGPGGFEVPVEFSGSTWVVDAAG